jgi:uncharacterized protein YbcC (UPF0753/DUF2309 family)
MKKEEMDEIRAYYNDILPEAAKQGIEDIYDKIKEIEERQNREKTKNLAQIKTNLKNYALLHFIR